MINPRLTSFFLGAAPRFQYGFRHLAKVDSCQAILDKLNLKLKYSPNVDIVDVFSGYGLFSTMLNMELKPRNHVIIENNKVNVGLWMERISHLEKTSNNSENFRLYPYDGYKWETYEKLIKDGIIAPKFQPRDKINDELLIVGNLTPSKFGEALFAQWIMCCIYKNWLQKYGRVRMLCFVPDVTAMKFISGAKFRKRNKSAVKRELFTDSLLVAISTPADFFDADGKGYDPRLILKDDPIPLGSADILPNSGQLALIELEPRDVSSEKFDEYDYVIRSLYFGASNKLRSAINNVGHGAVDDLTPHFTEEMLDKNAKELTLEDWMRIFEVYEKWPFKPSYIETLDIVGEEN